MKKYIVILSMLLIPAVAWAVSTKLTGEVEISSVADADLFDCVDVSGPNLNRKCPGAKVKSYVNENITGNVVGTNDTQTLTGKTIDASSNTIQNVGTAELEADSVTYDKMQDTAASDIFLGRDTALGGTVEEITATAARTILNIESGATADQTDGEIKTAYENNADTNEFSDAEQTKLSGIETSADVTDNTNVEAALPIDDSNALFEDNLDVTKELNFQLSGITTGTTRTATWPDKNITVADDADVSTKLPLAGGTMTGNITMSGSETVDGRDLSVDGAKLDAVEASADVTDATNVAASGAVMDSDIAPAEGFMRKTGAGAYTAIKSNLGASVAPSATDDSAAGYVVGSLWLDTTADKAYRALDVTATAAVWVETTQQDTTAASQNLFETIGVDAGGTPVADTATDTLTIAGGNSITATGDAGTDTVTLGVDNLGIDTAQIAEGGVTYAKIQDISATNTFLGRDTAGAGSTEEITAAAARTILNIENGADVTDETNVAAANAIMDSDVSEAEGFMRKTGSGVYEAIKTNLAAAVAPTINEDSGDGYAVGSLWIDTTADKTYVLVDATVGAAVWNDVTATGGAPATADISDVAVTQTEFAELETIGATTISANQWAALGGIAETLGSAELNLLDGLTVLSGSNTGDDDTPDSDAEVPDAITVAGGTIANTTTITLEEQGAADPTIDGRIEYDTTTETLKIGDDGVATLEFFPGAHTTDTNTQLSQEQVEDFAGALAGTGGTKTRITVTYQDGTGDMDFVVDDMNDDIPEAGDFGAATDLDANGAINADAVGTASLKDGADTPLAGECVVVATATTDVEYITCPGGATATADITDVSVTQTELAELETIGTTSISAADWTAVSNLAGVNTGDDDIPDAGDFGAATDLDANGAINAGAINEPMLDGDVAPVDLDFLQYDSTGTNFTWRSPAEVLSDIGAEPAGITEADISDLTHTTDTTLNDTGSQAITGDWDFGGGGLEIENGITPPACTVGQIYLDTDATSGQQLMACESGTFVKQGDGSGSGMSNLLDDLTPQLGGQLDVNTECLGDGTLELLCFTETGSAVNEVTVTNAATAGDPVLSATGTDTNIDLKLAGKGTGIPIGMRKYAVRPLVAAATDTATATTVAGDFRIPFTGTIKRVGCYVATAGTTGTMTIDIHKAGTTIMTTNKITLDTTEKSSETAATAPALTTTAYTADDILTFDIDAIHTTAAKGLECWLDIELTAGG